MSKTCMIYHSKDLDGWMSAAIVKKWYLEKHYGNTLEHGNVIVDPNEGSHSLTFLGYNYGNPIPDLSEYDKVIMCDISFPKEEMIKLSHKLIWNDHHISAIMQLDTDPTFYNETKGLRNTKFAACELTYKYFFPNEPMPEIVRLLGMYDSFRHKGTEEEQKVLEFQYGARQVISDYKEAYRYLYDSLHIPDIRDRDNIINTIHSKGKSIYKYLCTEAKQIYKNGVEIEFYWAKDIGRSNGNPKQCNAKFICINRERFNPINFGIDYHKDGYDGVACFWFENGQWSFSLYNDNGEVDCSLIAKQYGGGGHAGASGFRCSTNTLLSIIKQ